jgi:acetylornithine deacetylase
MPIKDTLARLVAIDSVSSRSNVEITNYLAARSEALGFSVRPFPYIDDKGVEKVNLIALAGTEFTNSTKVELALIGHTDTVPYDPDWQDALKLTERDGKLFARGACDTKAFIAAALSAVESIDLKDLKRPLALIFTADEEVGLIGAKRLAKEQALHPRFAIVGEPTSLQPMRAGKGYSLAEITVKGREAHSAYPDLGASAIFGAATLIQEIEKIAEELRHETQAAFEPPFTTLNVGLIRGGTAKNVIPSECRLTLEWRPIPGQQSERVLDLLSAAIKEQKKKNPDFDCEVDAARADEGYETSPDSELVTLLEGLSGKEAGTVAFGTEAAQMTNLGAEAVVLGAGDIRVAHRTGEFVPVEELESSVEILTKTIQRLCA